MAAGAVIRDADGRILLVEPGYRLRRWDLPGGRLVKGESFEDGLVREVHEETGLDVRVGPLRAVDAIRPHRVVLIFEAEVVGGRERTQPGGIRSMRWFPPDGLPELVDVVRARLDAVAAAIDEGGSARYLGAARMHGP